MTEGVSVRLGDAADFLTGFPFKSTDYTEDCSGIRLLRGDNIVQGALRWDGVKRWPENLAIQHDIYRLLPGDVVLAMDRPWIEAGLKYAALTEADCPSLLVQRVTRLRETRRITARYLRYIIGGRRFTEYVLAVQTGTAVPHISGGQIKAFEFFLPSIQTQEAIASVLGALDDKIELNRRMNETLEAMARAIFKDWFVDFGPTRAKIAMRGEDPQKDKVARTPYLAPDIWSLFPDRLDDDGKPEGWNWAPLTQFFEIVGGGTPKTSEPAYWGGHIPWFSVVDTPLGSDTFVFDTEKNISDSGLENSSARLLDLGDTIISARGTVGNLAMAGRPMAFNQSCYGLKGTKGYGPCFVFLSAKHMVTKLQSLAHGSVFSTITRQTFESVHLPAPGSKIANQFELATSVLFERIRGNVAESRTLAATRDFLLPKLMSGEVRVRDAEKLVGEAT